MKFQFKEVRVRMRDGAAVVQKRIPAWEVPVLQCVWPDTQEVRDIVEERDNVTVQGEYDRLAALYGSDGTESGERGIPLVAVIYGQHGAGIVALRNAIQATILPEDTEVTPLEVPPTINSDLYAAIKPDVVAGLAQERTLANARLAKAAEQLVGQVE